MPIRGVGGILDGTMADEMERRLPDRSPSEGVPGSGPPKEQGAVRTVPAFGWRLVAWGGLIALLAVVASDLTGLWWLVLLFGLLVPAVSALHALWSENSDAPSAIPPEGKEGELLGALGELGELTPTTAAMRTSLTVEEAAGMLEKLAKRGHLEAKTQGAVVLYGLWDADRGVPGEELPTASAIKGGEGSGTVPGDRSPGRTRPGDRGEADPSVPPLVEPLTEREEEVFALLATGHTNREIASELFVTVGTIKAHTSNIYAKLQARNRAEAISRARELGLLD